LSRIVSFIDVGGVFVGRCVYRAGVSRHRGRALKRRRRRFGMKFNRMSMAACIATGFVALPVIAWFPASAQSTQSAGANGVSVSSTATPFTFQAQLEGANTEGGNTDPLRRVQVPMSVYDSARDPQLRDLRVFNAQGLPLSFAWVDQRAAPAASVVQAPVPMFAIHGRAARNPGEHIPLPVTLADNGSLAPAKDADSEGRSPIGAIFDLTKVAGDLQALVFADYQSDTPLHSFSLEASTDLKKWMLLRQEAQIVRLKQDDHVLDQNVVELGAIPIESARYLRLLWRDPKNAPQLRRMEVRASTSHQNPQSILWTEPQSPVNVQQNSYEFTTPPALPIDRLRINLSRTNTMAPVQVEQYVEPPVSPPAQAQPGTAQAPVAAGSWQVVARQVAYRLESGVSEIVAPDIALGGRHFDRLRVSIDTRGGRGDAPPPTIQVGFHPRTLVFKADGAGPYLLAWGMQTNQDVSVAPGQLIAGYTGSDALPASIAPMEALQRLSATNLKVSLVPLAASPLAAASHPRIADVRAFGSWFTAMLVVIDLILAFFALRAIKRSTRPRRGSLA
jgi:hypothetical protein